MTTEKDPYKTTYETGYYDEGMNTWVNTETREWSGGTLKIYEEDPGPEEESVVSVGQMSAEEYLKTAGEWVEPEICGPEPGPEVDFRFDEGDLIDELRDYIASTYDGHYNGEKYQATDLIIDAGHGEGFCIGNIIKYAKRYGKKDGYNEKDIMKILHYAIILWHVHRREGR